MTHDRIRAMRSAGQCRLWVAAMLVPLLSSVALASAPVSFTCEGDLVARPECCSPVCGPVGTSGEKAHGIVLSREGGRACSSELFAGGAGPFEGPEYNERIRVS